jgi:H+/Cl- antiporter ClcA
MPEQMSLLSVSAWRVRLVLWLGAIIIGVVAAFFAWSGDWVEIARNHLFQQYPWLPWIVTPLGIMIAVWITRHWAPGARGSGIPQAIAALQNSDERYRLKLLSFRIAFWKLVLTLLGLFSGASIGREGPTVHIGASVMFRLGRFARFPHHLLERGLILAGGAAGISAAFNTPLAGIMFAIEEMARSFEERSSGAVLTAVLLAGVIAVALLGNYTYFGNTDVSIGSATAWLAVPLCGIAGGLLGGLFSITLIQGSRRLVPIIKRAPMRLAFLAGLLLAAMGIWTEGASFGSGYHHAKDILTGASDSGLEFSVAKIFATWVSYFTGIPGGIFAPSLAAGAGLGSELAPLVPATPVAAMVILGMVAYFTGVVQTPITAAMIVMEMTANPSMVLPILGTAFIALGTSKLLCRNTVYWSLAEDLLEKQEARRDKGNGPPSPDEGTERPPRGS